MLRQLSAPLQSVAGRNPTVVVATAAAALAVTLLLMACSVLTLAGREADRAANRSAIVASRSSPHDLIAVGRDDVWRSQQFSVIWIEPAGTGRSVLPPGVHRMPAPGESVVSPALDRLASTHTSLDARYTRRRVLDPRGIAFGGELLAYRRPNAGRTLAGDERALRISGFGDGGSASPRTVLAEHSELVDAPVLPAAILLLVLPALLLLVTAAAVGAGAVARTRDGNPSGRSRADVARRRLTILSLAGVVPAGLWATVVPTLGKLPLVDREVAAGDLAIGLGTAVTVVAGGAALAALAGLMGAASVTRRRGALPAPVEPRRPIAALNLVLIAGLIVAGYLGLQQHVPSSLVEHRAPSGLIVRWLDANAHDHNRLTDSLRPSLVAPIAQRGKTLLVGASCDSIARQVPSTRCRRNGQFELPPTARRRLSEVVLGSPDVPIRLAPPSEVPRSGNTLVVGDEALGPLEARVRVEVLRRLPAPTVVSPLTFVKRPSPLLPWIVGGFLAAFITIAAAFVVRIFDRLAYLAETSDVRGSSLPAHHRLARLPWRSTLPVCYAAVTGGALCAAVVVGAGAPVPWTTIAVMAIALALMWLGGLGAIALCGNACGDAAQATSNRRSSAA